MTTRKSYRIDSESAVPGRGVGGGRSTGSTTRRDRGAEPFPGDQTVGDEGGVFKIACDAERSHHADARRAGRCGRGTRVRDVRAGVDAGRADTDGGTVARMMAERTRRPRVATPMPTPHAHDPAHAHASRPRVGGRDVEARRGGIL